jgi:hypothetical protein
VGVSAPGASCGEGPRAVRGRATHLVRRFAGSLWPGGPSRPEEAWAQAQLRPAELALWRAMSGPDRRHACAVARRVRTRLGDPPQGRASREVLAAALLHDVGKLEAGLGTAGRVVATLAELVAPRRVEAFAGRDGFAGRIGRYLAHDRLGADLLERAGSDPLVVAWARGHHRPRAASGVPAEIGDALKAADDD